MIVKLLKKTNKNISALWHYVQTLTFLLYILIDLRFRKFSLIHILLPSLKNCLFQEHMEWSDAYTVTKFLILDMDLVIRTFNPNLQKLLKLLVPRTYRGVWYIYIHTGISILSSWPGTPSSLEKQILSLWNKELWGEDAEEFNTLRFKNGSWG